MHGNFNTATKQLMGHAFVLSSADTAQHAGVHTPAAKRQRAVLTRDAEKHTNKNFNLFYRLRTGRTLVEV